MLKNVNVNLTLFYSHMLEIIFKILYWIIFKLKQDPICWIFYMQNFKEKRHVRNYGTKQELL